MKFKEILERTAEVFQFAQRSSAGKGNNKKKHGKLSVFSVFFLLEDLTADKLFRFDNPLKKTIAEHVLAQATLPAVGKTVTGKAIQDHYFIWRMELPQKLGLHLDPQRLFSEIQKQAISAAQSGKCALCQTLVEDGDAEYDHYPMPHYMGGRTRRATVGWFAQSATRDSAVQ